MSQGMVRPAVVVVALVALAGFARAASTLPRRLGMYSTSGNSAFAMVDSKINVRVRGPLIEAIVTQTFRNDTDRVTEATYIFPLPYDAAVSAMEIEVGARTIRAAIESREQAQQRYERAVAQGVGAALLDQERPDVFTQTVSAIPARGTVTVTLRVDSIARYQSGTWELVLPLVIAPRYVPGTASGRPTTGTGRAPDTDRAPDASRVTPAGTPGAGGKTDVTIEFADPVDGVTSVTHELRASRAGYAFTDPKSDHDAVIRWKSKTPAAGWVETSDDGGFAAVVVEAPHAAPRKAAVRIQLILDRGATTRGDAEAVKRPFVRALLGALDRKDQVSIGGDWRAPEQIQRALDESVPKPNGPFDLTKTLGSTRADGALLLISDGLVADDRAVLAAAGKLGVPIHVIGIGPAPNRSLLAGIAATTGGTIRFIGVGDDFGALARDVIADAAAPPEPLKITWGTLQPIEVVPATPPRIGAGQAALVVAKVKRVQTANARVRNDVIGFVAVTPARPPDGATSARGALGRRWAKQRLDELIASGNQRAITEHALRYGLVSPYTSMVAIGGEVIVQGGVKHSVPVAVSVPEGMQWQLVKQATTVEKAPEAPRPDSNVTLRDERKNKKKAAPEPKTEHKPTDTVAKDKDKKAPAAKEPPVAKAPVPVAKPPAGPRGGGATAPVATGNKPPRAEPAPAPSPAPPAEPETPVAGQAAPPPPPPPAPKRESTRDEEEEDNAPRSSSGSVATATEAGGEEDEDDAEIQAAPVMSQRRALRLALSLGAGVSVVNDRASALGALNGRVEVGGRTKLGIEGSLWISDGVQGSVLGALSRRLTQRLELGIGTGVRITSDKLGPAWDLVLRTQLLRHLSVFLRYDGALLLHDQTFDGQNAGSVGLEATW